MRDLIRRTYESLSLIEMSMEDLVKGVERLGPVHESPELRVSIEDGAVGRATPYDLREDLNTALTETRANIKELMSQLRVGLDINLAERRGEELNRALSALRLELPEEIVRDLTAVVDRRLDKE